MRVDIERTQAVQYFDYNGAGTGFGPDNSIPLIARKDLFLRVYLQPSFFDFIPTSGTDATATLSFNGLRYTPLNQRVRITPTFTSNRAVEGSTLNFYVPGYLCT